MFEGVDMGSSKLGVICQPLPATDGLPPPPSKAGGDLSTVAGPTAPADDLPKAGGDLSTVVEPVPSFEAIERRRIALGIPVTRLLHAAGVHPDTRKLAKRGGKTRGETLQRLARGLDLLQGSSVATRPPSAIAALIRSIEQNLLNEIDGNRRLMAACDPVRRRRRLPRRVPAGRMRLIAIYIATVELEIKNPEVARALGIERQAVKQARDKIHDLRDDKKFDALIESVAAAVTGTAP